MGKVVPRRTRHGSGLGATRHDGSFLFVFFRLSSAQSAVAHCNSDPVNYVDLRQVIAEVVQDNILDGINLYQTLRILFIPS